LGAGVDQKNADPILQIVQLQGLVELMENFDGKEEFYKNSSLHGGLLWRDTLVQAAIEVARKIGVRQVGIVAAHNLSYANQYTIERYQKGYDEVALRMGFEREPILGNFVLEI